MRLILSLAVITMSILASVAQTDTIVTRLHEIAVVGIKQNIDNEMAATTEITSAETQRLNIVSMKGASELVPNFYMPDYGSRMTSSIYVRGLGARIDQPVVGLSIDNVPYLNKDVYDFDLFDIEKIEVYRGAQSILNGRNTMAGQVNITTLSPWRYQGVRMMAEYGRANSLKAGLGYYTKLRQNLASSVNVYYTSTDGYFRNEHNGARLDTERQGTARWKLSWHPSERLSLTNVASAQISRQGGYPYMSLTSGKIAFDDTCFYRRNSFAEGLTIGWTGKRVVVTSVTSAQYIDDNMTLDQDFLPLPYFTLTQKRKEYDLTQDIYAKGHRGALSWLGGVFAFYKHTDMKAPVTFKADGIANLIEKHPNEMNPSYPIKWNEPSFVLGSDFINVTKGVAVYEQSSYTLDRWKFELGLRLDIEHGALDYLSHCNTSYTTYHVLDDGSKEFYREKEVNINEAGKLKHTFVELLPKIAIGYQASDACNLYVNVAKGYKSGGFNTQMFSDVLQQKLMERFGLTMKYDVDKIVSYEPEKSWNFEIGGKAVSADRRLSAEATLFYILCTNQQLTTFPDGLTTGRIMTNAGKTRSYGAELSVNYRPTPSVTLIGSYGYTNAKFVKYHNGKADMKGKRLPYAPQNTAFISANYLIPYSYRGIRPTVNVNARGIGDIYWDDANEVKQPFYVTCGASIALEHERWSLRIWGENLTDTKYDTFYFVSMGNAFVQKANPVTYGATLRVNL